MKRKLKITLFILAILALLLVFLHEKRQFYSFDNGKQWVTVWKRYGGKTCVISGKYYGLFKPDDNYVETFTRNAATVVYDPNSGYDWVLSNDYGSPLEVYSSHNRILVYSYEDKKKFWDRYYYINGKFKGPPYEYLMMDFREGMVIKNGVRLSPK